MDPDGAQSAFEYSIDRFEQLDDGIGVFWSAGGSSQFHFLWLRDNCLCAQCGDPLIGKKRFRITTVTLDIAPASIELLADSRLRIVWDNDAHESLYDSAFLKTHAYDDSDRRARRFEPTLWDRSRLASPPTRAYSEVTDDAGLHDVLSTVAELGLCFITALPIRPGELERFASRIGYIQESNYGRILDLSIDPAQRSSAYAADELVPHTDEPYRAAPPGILLFNCIETCARGGGQSIFVDGFRIAEQLREEDPAGFDALCTERLGYRRHFEHDVDVMAEFPLISVDEFGAIEGVRINDRVAEPLSIAPGRVADFYRAHRRLLELSTSAGMTIARTLEPGDLAIFDNHRILHGRTAIQLQSRRRLQWCQLKRGDLFSSLRLLRERLDLPRDERRMPRGAYG